MMPAEVPLRCPRRRLGKQQLAVGGPHPMDDENDLRGGVLDIGHELVDEGAHKVLLCEHPSAARPGPL